MIASRRKILQVLFGIAVLAGIPLFASPFQDAESSYSPEGAWLCHETGKSSPLYWMDTYTSDSKRPGVSGTLLCTLPLSISGITPSGHGNWTRVGKNEIAFTVLRILFDSNGKPFGIVKFWGTVTLDKENHLSGKMKSQNYWLNGTLISDDVLTTDFEGTRIEVEVG